MSIASPHDQKPHPDFTDLLARHSGLAGWLLNTLQNDEMPPAEKLLPSFLAECINQGISRDSYPFIREDQGLTDLQAYLQNAQAEIDSFVSPSTPRRVESSSPDAQTQEKSDITEQPTLHTEAVSPSSDEATVLSETPAQKSPAMEAEGDSSNYIDGYKSGNENATQAEDRADTIGNGTEQTQALPVAFPGSHGRSRLRKTPVRPARTRQQRILTRVLLLVILGAILVPVGFSISFGINAYTTYTRLSSQAHSAVNQLLAAKNVFYSGGKVHLSDLFDSTRLQQAQKDFVAAEHDFQQLKAQLQQSSTLTTITSYFPQYRTTFSSALAASTIGADAAYIGKIATGNAIQIVPSFRGPLLAASSKPLITQSTLDEIGVTIGQVLPVLSDIQAQAHSISLDTLPLSATQKAQVGQILQALPQAINDLTTARDLLGAAGWLLGVDQPRTFLVQTMDRAELRGTGGFTGQYGELKVSGGRIAPFSLTDISLIEYVPGSANQGQLAPEQYRSWWPFANWGLRDSNISADFPTSAQLAINLYKQETGNQVDGVISFTAVVIEHILNIIGPIQVPAYNTTVTAQNLEDLLHYYQLNNTGITKQYFTNTSGSNSTSTRKRFTNYLASLLTARVRSASPTELLAILQSVLHDLKTKDLQIYFTNPTAEDALMRYGYAGQMDRSTTHDGLYVVQQNLSASKASQYVQTILHDTVTLDSKGGATHVLQIRLVYDQAGPVYGYDTYYDYLRVYVPPTSQLLGGDGFSSGTPLCGGAYGNCPVNGPYPNGELQCPAGQYQPGDEPPTLTDPSGATWEPLQTLGPPTNTTSDEPGRAMYGGWIILPKNCTITVSLSWYVPPMSSRPYSLLVQRQAGTFPELDLTILPAAGACTALSTAGLHFDNILTQDTSFTLPVYKSTTAGRCYPGSGV